MCISAVAIVPSPEQRHLAANDWLLLTEPLKNTVIQHGLVIGASADNYPYVILMHFGAKR